MRVDFQGARVTSDGGLILARELDERLGFGELVDRHLSYSRRGKNIQLPLPDLLRPSIHSRLADYCRRRRRRAPLSGSDSPAHRAENTTRICRSPGVRTGHGSRAFHFRGTSASRRRRLIARGIRRNGGHKAEQISVTRENGRRSQTCVSIVDRMDEQSKASACRICRKPNMLLRTKWTLALLLAVSALFSAGPIGALAQGEGGNTPPRFLPADVSGASMPSSDM